MQNKNTRLRPILLFLFLSTAVFAQNGGKSEIDIIATPTLYEWAMGLKNPTVEQLDSLWELINMYCRISGDTCLALSEHGAAITKNSTNKVLRGMGILMKGKAHIEDSTGLELLLEAKGILQETDNFSAQSNAEAALGEYYLNSDDLKKALEYDLLSLQSAQQASDTGLMVLALNAVAAVYFHMGHLEKVDEYLDRTIQLMEALGNQGNKNQLPLLILNKGSVLRKLGDKYLTMVDTTDVGSAIYRDSAEYFFREGMAVANRAFSLLKEMNHGMGILASLNLISNLNRRLGNFKEAIKASEEVLAKAKEMQITSYIIQSHSALASAYNSSGQLDKALYHAEIGYQMSMENNTPDSPFNFEGQLYGIYKKMGRTKDALSMLEKLKKHTDELNETETKKAIADAETKYQTAEKEKEILSQKNDILELENKNEKIAKQRNFIMAGGILFSLLGFFGYRFNKVQKDRNDKKAFAEALIFAQEEERKRIARDLHDGIGQSLLLIKKQLVENTEVTQENQRMISDTLEEVRSISRDLHPFQLEKFGLTSTINDMVDKVEKSTDIFISKELDNIDNILPAKSEIHLFRTIQEALSNIVKHAGATAAKVSIKNKPSELEIIIQDNGKGFDLEVAVVASKSLGIKTMHERISSIGGKLKINNGENGGTQIIVNIPKK